MCKSTCPFCGFSPLAPVQIDIGSLSQIICPQKPKEKKKKTGTIIAMKHPRNKAGELLLIHTLW